MAIRLTGVTYDKRMIDYTDALKKAEIQTNRMDTPGKMTFEGVEDSGIALPEGSAVTFTDDGTVVFKGYVFTAKRDRYGNVSYTAYDQLRYLKSKQSYTFENQSLEQIITQIATDFNLTLGTLEPTGYIFPSLIKENETCLDIIFDALSKPFIRPERFGYFTMTPGR